MNSKVFSIIVTYNPVISELYEVLTSHLKTSTSGIVIIDNNSLNNVLIKELISSNNIMSNIIFQKLENNMGIGYAQNIGINIAQDSNCSHVLLFDQDSYVPSDIVDKLLLNEKKLIADGQSPGAVGPNYIDTISRACYKQVLITNYRVKYISPNPNLTDMFKVSFLNSSGTLIRLSVLKQIGMMNEGLFIDSVDIEWCFRASSYGLSFFVVPDLILNHTIGIKRGRSLGREISFHSPLRNYYMVRNKFLLLRFSWVPMCYKIKILIDTIFKSPIYFIDMNFNKDFIVHYFKGLRDGLKNKSGKLCQ